LTETHIREYGKPELFHTIGLAERKFSDDPKKNLELKKYAYKRFLSHIQEAYPNAKTLIAAWDFYIRLTPDEVQEIIQLFDPEHTLILDYTADLKYEKSCIEKWGVVGKFPWIFGLFHGYMPQSHVHGDYEFIAKKISEADADPYCKGMDFWPEMSHSDTLMLSYFAENAWRPTGRSIEEVAEDLCRKRYGAAAEQLWDIWRTALPLLRLPDIDYTSCAYNLLQNIVLVRVTDTTHPDHEKYVRMWTERTAKEKSFDGTIVTLLQKIRALPGEVLEDPFVLRDCVDLVRSVLTQMLHIHYVDAALQFAAWQRGEAEAEAVLAKWTYCRGLLESFPEVLNTHADYSMLETLREQGKDRPVNPFFAEALKENLLNKYCRTAAYELAAYVYRKEADVLGDWIVRCVAEGQTGAFPTAEFQQAQDKIRREFMELPFEAMHPTGLVPLHDAIDRLLARI